MNSFTEQRVQSVKILLQLAQRI